MGIASNFPTGAPRSRLGLSCWLVIFAAAFISAAAAEPAGQGEVRKNSLTWVGHFDPELNYLSARAVLQFDRPSPERMIWLADGLRLESVRGATPPVVIDRPAPRQYLLRGPSDKELELSYSGTLPDISGPASSFADRYAPLVEVQLDRLIYLSCVKDFYPNAGMDFGNIFLNISVPNGWNCLGSGILRRVEPSEEQTHYVFDNAGGKGMSLVFGRFAEIGRLDSFIPVRLHGWPQFNSNWYFPHKDVLRILDFYHERFGPLDLPELHILFQRGRRFGGVSYSGLVIIEVDSAWSSFSLQTRKNIRTRTPLSILDAKTDVLCHELAHQWWGGLVSWKTPQDNWISEGLATYSSLICLRAWKGEKPFRRALAWLRDQAKIYAKLGAPAGDGGLSLFRSDLKAYQAVVYGKPALMFAALGDRIGERELCSRLRSILRDRRHSNLGTAEFLGQLAAGDEALLNWMKTWICRSGLPGEA